MFNWFVKILDMIGRSFQWKGVSKEKIEKTNQLGKKIVIPIKRYFEFVNYLNNGKHDMEVIPHIEAYQFIITGKNAFSLGKIVFNFFKDVFDDYCVYDRYMYGYNQYEFVVKTIDGELFTRYNEYEDF